MPPKNIIIGQKVNPTKVLRAKELRQSMTEAETALWQALRANRLNGWHFRRQQIIRGFIVDFYCHAAALGIELDGGVHKSRKDYDQERDQILRSCNIEVIRFTNEEVLKHLPEVLKKIDMLCQERVSRT